MRIALGRKDHEGESDDYLIELMGLKADFPEEAMDAYGKIYSRYWDIMFLIAQKVTQDEKSAGDLLADTFNLVFQRAATFKKGKVSDPGNLRFCIQKWMTTIMRNVYYDHYLDEAYKKDTSGNELQESYIIEKASVCKLFDDDYDGFVNEMEASEMEAIEEKHNGQDISDNIVKVKEYLAKLQERDRDIILTVYDHYIPGKYTPPVVLNELVQKWGTTKDNIRKIMEKFRKAIKQELQPKLTYRNERNHG